MEQDSLKKEPGDEAGEENTDLTDSASELEKLKRSRAGYKAAITKKQNHIEGLLIDSQNSNTVFSLHSKLADSWQKFDQAHRAVVELIADDEDAVVEEGLYYEEAKLHMANFDKKVTEWLEKAREEVSDDIKPEESASQVSHRSSALSSFIRQKTEEEAKRRAAEIRLQYLQEEEKLEEETRKLRLEEERLKKRTKLLKAKQELDECSAREEVFKRRIEEARDGSLIQSKSGMNKPTMKKEELNPNAAEFLPTSTPRPQVTADEILKQATSALSLPKQEVPTFGGNPLEYNNFIIAFKSLIEEKTDHASTRLYYLLQYTSGDVKELVRSCLAMNPAEGYKEALRLIKTRYGQNYRIATAFVDRITKGSVIKSEDTASLQKFSILLTSCNNTLKSLGYSNMVENPETFRSMVAMLPFELRRKWRTVADYISEEEHSDIKFENFVTFMEKEARRASHPVFGNLVKDGNKDANNNRKGDPKRKAATFATSASPKESTRKCVLCTGDHALPDCEQFIKQDAEARSATVRKLGLCFNCLNKHLVKDCRKEQRYSHCSRKHSSLLHQYVVAHANDNTSTKPNNSSKQAPGGNSSGGACVGAAIGKSQSVGLQIVPVKVKTSDGTWIKTNAFLDNGSNMSFCSQALINKIGIQGRKTSISLTTLDNKGVLVEGELFALQIQDCNQGDFITELSSVICRPELPISQADIPTQNDVRRWDHLKGIDLKVDDIPVGILIGNDFPEILQPLEVRLSKDGGPYAVRTVLGWTVNGPLGNHRQILRSGTCNLIQANSLLSQQIQDLFNHEFQESLSDPSVSLSQNDAKALRIMSDSLDS